MTRTDVDEPHIPSVQQEQAPCFTKYTLLQMHYNIYEEKKYWSNPHNLLLPREFCRDNLEVAADWKSCSSHASFFPGANFSRQQQGPSDFIKRVSASPPLAEKYNNCLASF